MNRKIPTVVVLTAIAATSALALSGCSGSGGNTSSEPKTVTVGYSGGGVVDTYMSQIIAQAKKDVPGVTIKTEVYPTYDDQLNQLPTQFASGTAPDIILWDNSAPIAQYADGGAIKPMDDLIKGTDVDLKSYPDALVKGWTINGKLYSVPSYLQNSGFAYNQDVLSAAGVNELPTTMNDVASDAATVKNATGKPGVVLLDNLFHLTQYAIAFGGGWDYGKSIDSKQNVAGMDWLLTLMKNGEAATAKQVGATWDGEAFGKNEAAMSDAGPWYIGFMSSTAPNTKYSLQPMPTTEAGKQVVATYGGGFSVSAKTKSPQTAAKVIASLTNKSAQKAIITTGLGYVPAMTQYASQYREATPAYAAFTEQVLANGRGLDYPKQATEFGNALVSGFQQLAAGGSTSSKSLLEGLQKKYGE
ncbi:MAG: Carbohydrate transporter substrate-binding protein family [Microbacteriaceae bacterium]|jgi:multiple sugar transport system substrate-binding protein|nr:Carbohydrate transporter substrate-binding protein family [Microbacteriaceae bacterium]